MIHGSHIRRIQPSISMTEYIRHTIIRLNLVTYDLDKMVVSCLLFIFNKLKTKLSSIKICNRFDRNAEVTRIEGLRL